MAIPDRVRDERAPFPTSVREFVRRHPLTSFFTLTFALSWIAWTPYVLSDSGLGLEDISFPVVLGSTQLLGVLPGAYLGPILAAVLVTAIADGRTGVRRWAGRVLKWRVDWRWYVSIIVGVPAVLIVTSIPFAGGWDAIHLPTVSVLVVYLPALAFQMVTTGLAEEPGWRDFALPRLQPRFGPLRGTLILGPLWGAWHLPLFLTEWGGWPNVTWVEPVEFVASAISLSVVMTWAFNRTGESLPLAMLLHTSVNNFFSVAWSSIFPEADPANGHRILLISSTAVALVLIIATRGRLGYPTPVEAAQVKAAG